MTTVVEPHTFIMRRLKDALKDFIEQQALEKAILDIKYHGQDPTIVFLWPHGGMTRGILISFGQNDDLQLEIYGAVDYGSYRKWRTEFLERLPDVIDSKADWLPLMMVAIRGARTMVNSWNESSLTFTCPILTDTGWIEIKMGSMQSLTPSRGSDTVYRLQPLTLCISLFVCFVLMLIGAYMSNSDARLFFFFTASIAEVGILAYHATGKKLNRRR